MAANEPVFNRPDSGPPGPATVNHLRTPLFRTLVTGWALANFADSLLMIILAVWVTDLTDSALLGGVTFAVLGLPALGSPFLGDLADRVSRRGMLAVAYVVGAAGLMPLFWVENAGAVWLIYLSTVIYSTVSYVTGACQSGLLRDTLPDSALGRANGILSMIDQVFRVALPFLGAGVYAWAGMKPLLGAAVGTFLLAAVVFATLRVVESCTEREREPYRKAVVAGFRHLFGTRPLGPLAWSMIVVMAALGLVNGVIFAMLEHLGVPAAWLGPLMVGQGIGGIAAGVLAPRLMDRYGRVSVYAAGISVLGVSLAPMAGDSVILVVVSQLAVGFAVTSAIIAFVTERQIATPERLQGRVAAASQVLLNLPGVLVTAGAAATLAVLDYRLLILLTVVLLVAAGLVTLRYREGASPSAPL